MRDDLPDIADDTAPRSPSWPRDIDWWNDVEHRYATAAFEEMKRNWEARQARERRKSDRQLK